MTDTPTIVDLMAPVGPVAEAFVQDQRFLTAIMGPYGSAKTTSCIRKIVQSVQWQRPGRDGVRRARWCVVRDTYQQLETNVLKSWFTWFPKTDANYNGREMVHRLRYNVIPMDGTDPYPIELEMFFRAMGDQKAEQVLKGLELTGLWLNEVDTLDHSVLRFGLPRTGRYPPAKDGGCAWSGVIADFNAPDIDNWTYKLFVEKKLPVDDQTKEAMQEALGARFGIGFFQQPGGRSVNPPPENIRNLEPGYYSKIMIGMTPADVRRFVDNEFGAVYAGQPVYPEFNEAFHDAKGPLLAEPDVPICAGLDAGATPALVFGQRVASGQIRSLREVVIFRPDTEKMLEKLGPRAFGRECGETWMEHFGRHTLGQIWSDPAAYNGETEEYSWIREFEAGWFEATRQRIKVKPAPVAGNRIPPRLEAVRAGLVQNVGGQPGQLVGADCPILLRGFKAGYVIQRVQTSNGSGRWKSDPVKNDFSHVHDAKQYLDLGLTKRGDTMLAQARGEQRPRERRRPNMSFGNGHFAPSPRGAKGRV